MSATIVPWPERALKLRIEVNTSLVIKLGLHDSEDKDNEIDDAMIAMRMMS